MFINTLRFKLRPLSVTDVSPRYLSWLSEPYVRRFIRGAVTVGDDRVKELKSYVAVREGRSDVLFLAIFTHEGSHIGNIKYEPIDQTSGVAIMGILIGDLEWRGKAVAGEVIHASAMWLREHRGIQAIALSVDRDNLAAVRAYKKLGFIEETHPLLPTDMTIAYPMVWHL